MGCGSSRRRADVPTLNVPVRALFVNLSEGAVGVRHVSSGDAFFLPRNGYVKLEGNVTSDSTVVVTSLAVHGGSPPTTFHLTHQPYQVHELSPSVKVFKKNISKGDLYAWGDGCTGLLEKHFRSGWRRIGYDASPLAEVRRFCLSKQTLFVDALFAPEGVEPALSSALVEWVRMSEVRLALEPPDDRSILSVIRDVEAEPRGLAAIWLVQSMAAALWADDCFFAGMVLGVDSGDGEPDTWAGAFAIRYYDPIAEAWLVMLLDDIFPAADGRIVLPHRARDGQSAGGWLPLLCKAFAKLFGSYSALTPNSEHGDDPQPPWTHAQAMAAMLGLCPLTWRVGVMKAAGIWAAFEALFAADHAILATVAVAVKSEGPVVSGVAYTILSSHVEKQSRRQWFLLAVAHGGALPGGSDETPELAARRQALIPDLECRAASLWLPLDVFAVAFATVDIAHSRS